MDGENKSNGNKVYEPLDVINGGTQEFNFDEWDNAKLAELVDFDDTPEIPSEIFLEEERIEETKLPSGTVSQAELFDDPIQGKTQPRFSGNPFAKGGAVGLALLIIFGGGGLFLNAVMGSKPQSAPSVAISPTPQATPSDLPSSQETGKLKTQVAIGRQEDQIKGLEKSKGPKTNVVKTKTQQTAPQPSSPPRTAVQQTYRSPHTEPAVPRQYTPPPAPRTFTPTLNSSVRSQPVPAAPTQGTSPKSVEPKLPKEPTQQLDPMQQWMAMSRIGSYGTGDVGGEKASGAANPVGTTSVDPIRTANAASPLVTIPRAIPVVSATDGVVASGVPFPSTALPPESSAKKPSLQTPTSPLNPENREPSTWVPSPVTVPEPVPQEGAIPTGRNAYASSSSAPTLVQVESKAASAQINPAEEASILSGVPVRRLTVGGMAQGQLVTPVIWAGDRASTATQSAQENAVGEKFIVQLQQPLVDKDGSVAMPAGTQIVAAVVEVNQSGLAILNVTRAVIDGQEYVLPPGSINIRGNDGQPLMAQRWGDKGPAIASGDITTFLFGAASRVGQVLTQPDTQSSTSVNGYGFSSSTTSSSGDRNILGAILDGGFTPLTQQILKRNERGLEEMMSRPNVWYVRAGATVQVFVNQSFEF